MYSTKAKSIFKKTGKAAKILLCLVLLLCMTVPSVIPTQAKQQFTVNVTTGISGKVKLYTSAPFDIEITNNGANFEGRVQVIINQREKNYMFEKDVSIPANGKKTVTITVPIQSIVSSANVRIVNQKEKVLYQESVTPQLVKEADSVCIGVLSDDWSALSYVHGLPLYTMSNFFSQKISTYFYGLTAENFPTDSEALSMLDIIMITNFSTDTLSADQLKALDRWVQDGGYLLIGTGSTYTKVFSGLKSLKFMDYINASGVQFNKISTSYGLNTANTTMITPIDIYGSDKYEDNFHYLDIRIQNETKEKIAEFFSTTPIKGNEYMDTLFLDFYLANKTYMRANLSREYFYNNLSEKEWEDWGDKELAYYLFDSYFKSTFTSAYQYQLSLQSGTNSEFVSAQYVDAEIAVFPATSTGKQAYAGSLLADIKNSNDTLPITQKYRYGYGEVVFAGIDFTQNPLVSYSDKALAMTYILKGSLDLELRERITNYQKEINNSGWYSTPNQDYSDYGDVFHTLSTANIPPVASYSLILVAYLACIFILFAKLKKQKKTILFWGGQALLAVGFALLIYLFGLTTRMYKPELRVARIRELTKYVGSEVTSEAVCDVSTVILPSSKKYQLSFNTDKNYHYVEPQYYYYSSGSQISLNTYNIGLNKRAGENLFTINNTKPLGSEYFLGKSTSETHGSIDCSITQDASGYSGSVTNNYDADLERVIVLYDSNFFMVGDLKKGQTVTIDAQTPFYNSNLGYGAYYNRSSREYRNYLVGSKGGVDFLSLFVGRRSEKYLQASLRLELGSSINSMVSYDQSCIYVIGFTSDTFGDKVLTNNKCKELNYTMVVESIYLTDLIEND